MTGTSKICTSHFRTMYPWIILGVCESELFDTLFTIIMQHLRMIRSMTDMIFLVAILLRINKKQTEH